MILSTPEVSDILLFQITRGGDSFSGGNATSGREELYPIYINFIKEHFFLGNGSFKYYVDEGLHAHNSFLQTMAANGAIITILYIILIITSISKRNYLYVAPFLVCAMTQAFILWGASFNDFVFYCILLRKPLLNNANISILVNER